MQAECEKLGEETGRLKAETTRLKAEIERLKGEVKKWKVGLFPSSINQDISTGVLYLGCIIL